MVLNMRRWSLTHPSPDPESLCPNILQYQTLPLFCLDLLLLSLQTPRRPRTVCGASHILISTMASAFNLPAGLSRSDEKQARAVMRFLEANPRVVRGRTVLSLPGAANAVVAAFAVRLGASKSLLLRGQGSASVEDAEESAVIAANDIPSSRCSVSARPFSWPSGNSAASLTRVELAIEYLSWVL